MSEVGNSSIILYISYGPDKTIKISEFKIFTIGTALPCFAEAAMWRHALFRLDQSGLHGGKQAHGGRWVAQRVPAVRQVYLPVRRQEKYINFQVNFKFRTGNSI